MGIGASVLQYFYHFFIVIFYRSQGCYEQIRNRVFRFAKRANYPMQNVYHACVQNTPHFELYPRLRSFPFCENGHGWKRSFFHSFLCLLANLSSIKRIYSFTNSPPTLVDTSIDTILIELFRKIIPLLTSRSNRDK